MEMRLWVTSYIEQEGLAKLTLAILTLTTVGCLSYTWGYYEGIHNKTAVLPVSTGGHVGGHGFVIAARASPRPDNTSSMNGDAVAQEATGAVPNTTDAASKGSKILAAEAEGSLEDLWNEQQEDHAMPLRHRRPRKAGPPPPALADSTPSDAADPAGDGDAAAVDREVVKTGAAKVAHVLPKNAFPLLQQFAAASGQLQGGKPGEESP